MDDFYIPRLHAFAMGNTFTGSKGQFRFLIKPSVVKKTSKEVDFEASSMKAEYWHGEFCYEKSQMEGENVFPMTDAGRQEMIDWLISNI